MRLPTARSEFRGFSRQNGRNGALPMLADWNVLSEASQLALSREALRSAAATLAGQAELLAGEIDGGSLADRGGSDALRLFAAVLRAAGRDDLHQIGHA